MHHTICWRVFVFQKLILNNHLVFYILNQTDEGLRGPFIIKYGIFITIKSGLTFRKKHKCCESFIKYRRGMLLYTKIYSH